MLHSKALPGRRLLQYAPWLGLPRPPTIDSSYSYCPAAICHGCQLSQDSTCNYSQSITRNHGLVPFRREPRPIHTTCVACQLSPNVSLRRCLGKKYAVSAPEKPHQRTDQSSFFVADSNNDPHPRELVPTDISAFRNYQR